MTAAKLAQDTVYTVLAIEKPSIRGPRTRKDGKVTYGIYSIYSYIRVPHIELELIQTQMAQKPMLRAEVGMRVRCANKASAE